MAQQKAVIETHHLSIGYKLKGNKLKVIHKGLDLQLHTGEVTCLLGLNGAGKSTLLRTLCGFQPALSGNVALMGRPLSSYSTTRFALTVGVVLTEKTNAGGITVYELVSLGRHPYTGFFGQLKAHDKEVIKKAMDAVGISHKAANYVSELSDGERQKAMIAKTLAQECPIILLDEPTAFLDVTSRIETMVLLHRLAAEQQKAILLSSHDLELSIQMGDRLWMLKKDQPMICGTPEDLILSGAFGHFFEKEGILFNKENGKLVIQRDFIPIRLEGDPQTAYWVGNALQRNGFQPIQTGSSPISIYCFSPGEFQIQLPDKNSRQTHSVAEIIDILHQTKPYQS